MENFVFQNPTKIVFGKDTISEVGKYSKEYGKKVLLVYGMGSIKKNGVYDKITNSLDENKVEFFEYSGVESNPIASHTRKGIEFARDNNIDLILAAGGGSVIDEAKAIAAGINYEGDFWDFFEGKDEVKSAIPLIVVLTMPATSSEMNSGAVITRDEDNIKTAVFSPLLYPKISILDPTTTYSLPANYTAWGAVDAMSHILEPYFTHKESWAPIQSRFMEGLLKTLIEATERVINGIMDNHDDYEGRAVLMWGGTLAWNGLLAAGLTGWHAPNHMLEHPLSGFYNVHHGAGLSIVIPAWMTYYEKKYRKRFAQFARNVFGIDLKSDEETSKSGIVALKKWFQKIKSPVSFTEANLPKNNLEEIADSSVELAEMWGIDGYNREDILNIFKMCI